MARTPAHAITPGPASGTALGVEDRRILLDIARRAVTAAAQGAGTPGVDEAALPTALSAPHGAFVTLTKHGELRGCIGTLDFERPLWASVLGAARAAAIEDPRFAPLEASELPDVRLEISVLDPPVELTDLSTFEPARHGIIVERAWARGLLLPQVAAERGWDRPTTLRAACLKAGLPPNAWRNPGTRLQVFASVHFDEADEAGATAAVQGHSALPVRDE